MPETFNDRAPTPSGSPKPAKLGGAQGTPNAEPSANGAPAGGLADSRARALATGAQTYQALDTRAETSPLRATRAPISRFAGDRV